MKLNPETIARASSRHPWQTVVLWGVVLLLAGASSSMLLPNALTTDFDFTNTPEAKRALQIMEEKRLTDDAVVETFIIAGEAPGAIEDPAFVDTVNTALTDIAALGPDVVAYVGPSFPLPDDAAADPQVAALGPFPSEDGKAVLFTVQLTGELDEAVEHVPALEAIRLAATGDGTEAYILGQATSTEDFKKVSEEDLRVGESYGIIAAIIVLIIVFGTLVAGVIPILMGIFSIAVALGLMGVLGLAWNFSFFAPNLVSMMGLAVGIDYSLFIVSRYREERHRGREKLDAIGMAGATANRAVFFSGMTVVIALAGMLLVPTTIFRSLAGGAILVVLVSVAASMTLLPAVLSLLGDKINAGRVIGRKRGDDFEQGRRGGFWDKATRRVMSRPVVSLVVAAGFLIALSLPYFFQSHPDGEGSGIKTGLSGVSSLPDEIQTKQAFNTIVANFPEAGTQASAEIVIEAAPDAPGVAEGIQALETSLAEDPSYGQPLPPQPSEDGTVTLVSIPLAGAASDPQSEEAVAAIGTLRTEHIPAAFGDDAEVLVGGETAFVSDFFDISDRYTPVIIAIVLLLSFILLTVVFRSIVVPVKAIIMNLLSVGAAFGLIVLIFQDGGPSWAASIADALGFTQVPAIESWLPLFLFSILFGLSMDYHVFLLTRIREEYDKTNDNAEAVAYGLRTTGAIITGAAIIMVAVFSGFAVGRMTAFQQMGFGLAVAVLIDATIVRSILVPSTMRLLGDRNWYLPRWLQWLPKVDVEGHDAARHVQVPDTAAELVEATDRGDG